VIDDLTKIAWNGNYLKVTLNWYDPMFSSFAARVLVNDLDLRLVMPDGKTIVYGNSIYDTSAKTYHRDDLNNVEKIVLHSQTVTPLQKGVYKL
jgi:hypothetical protein